VNETVPFNISINDRHGNPIDNLNLNETHIVRLHVHGPGPYDDCGFSTSSGYIHDYNATLDANGKNASIIKLTSKIGGNYILMDSFGSISDKIESIEAMALGEPYSMTGTFYCISAKGTCEANNQDYFIFEYFLYDQYDNPLNGTSIWWNTTLSGPGEQVLKTTNSLGQIQIKYGPKSAINKITIWANSTLNQSVTNVTYAEFINSEPTNMVLAVTPATMPSREVSPSIKAYVRATVIDNFGNPVPDQTVSFQIKEIKTGEFVVNGTPSFNSNNELSTATALTKSDGNAEVFFYPGSFVMRTQPGYSNLSTASSIIEAQWTSTTGTTITRSTQVFWKNYPYLSIEASASNRQECVRLNDTFDVTINVTGDGYAMGAPVTALLIMDCGADMFMRQGERINQSRAAAKVFVDHMNQGQDYVGLTSYGTDNNLKWDLPPQPSLELVKINLDKLIKGNKAEFNQSIFRAINNITDTQPGRPLDVVRAVIILADPGGIGLDDTEILAIQMAANHTAPITHIFSVYYDNGTATSDKAEKTMIKLPNGTGNSPGRFYKPTTAEELAEAYFNISETLHLLAGVNTTMNVNSQNVQINTTEYKPGGEVFDYVPVGPFNNTLISAGQPPVSGRTRIIWPNTTQSVVNQSDDWTSDYQLNFTIGTINIKERWQATYRLKANQTGLIKLFDNTSTISFNDGKDTLHFPDFYITVCPNATPGPETGILDVSHLAVTKSGNFTDYIPLQWNLEYTGFNTTTETLCYCVGESCTDIRGCPNGPWVLFDTRADITPGLYTPRIAQLDVRNLPMGSYWVRVHAFAPDAPDDEETFGPVMVGYAGIFIKLT